MEESELIQEINKKTCNRFNFLKLKQVFFAVSKNICKISFIYPSEINLEDSDKEEISKIVKNFLNLQGATIEIDINKSFVEEDLIKREIFLYLSNHNPIVFNSLDKNNVLIEIFEGKNVKIKIGLEQGIFDLFEKFKIDKNLLKYLDKCFCAHFEIELNKKENGQVEDDFLQKRLEILKKQSDLDVVMNQAKEKYFVTNQSVLIGKEISFNPRFISTINKTFDSCVIAGRINFLTERSFTSKRKKKNKDGTEEPIVKPYFNFSIKDSSSTIGAVVFPSKTNYHKMHLLKNGDCVVVSGKISKFNDKFEITVKDISYCRIPNQNEFLGTVKQEELNNYRFVRPVKYASFKQSNLFDSKMNFSNEVLNHTFVVYDFETTGVDPSKEEIIEIGALKIVNGVFTEVFSTLVKPKKLIPLEATKINRITNDMVKHSFSIEQVICDFFVFCKGCQMVGYNNIFFDSQFLINAGKKVGLNFNNTQIDAFLLAKDKLKGLKNYKLATVSKYLDVNLIDAHRALNDVIATAETFLKLY